MDISVQPQELVDIFAGNCRSRRLALGLTQADIANRINAYPPYISDLEHGKKTPFLRNIAKIADALETTPDALLAGQ